MKITSSYGVELRKQNIPIRQTLDVYRSAVGYLTEIYAQVWEESFYLVLEAVGAVAVCYVAIADIIKTGDIGRLALISGAAVQMKYVARHCFVLTLALMSIKIRLPILENACSFPKF